MSPRPAKPCALRYARALLLLTTPATKPKTKIGPMEPSIAQQLAEEPEWSTLTEEQQRAMIGDAAWERQQQEEQRANDSPDVGPAKE